MTYGHAKMKGAKLTFPFVKAGFTVASPYVLHAAKFPRWSYQVSI